MNDLINYTLAYSILFVLFFGLINFLSNGFFTVFIRVKASRGKKFLVGVYALTDKYYKIGFPDGTLLKYKDRNKNKRSVEVKDRSNVYKGMGVNCIDVDEETNAVNSPDFSKVSGYDAVKFDNLLTRALYAPKIDDLKKQGLIILGVLVVLGVLAFIAFKVFTIESLIKGGASAVIR